MSHQVTLYYRKSTPGTHVFENKDDGFIKSIYVSKKAFNGRTPSAIILTMEDVYKGETTEKDLT
jgi:hypothetical protein